MAAHHRYPQHRQSAWIRDWVIPKLHQFTAFKEVPSQARTAGRTLDQGFWLPIISRGTTDLLQDSGKPRITSRRVEMDRTNWGTHSSDPIGEKNLAGNISIGSQTLAQPVERPTDRDKAFAAQPDNEDAPANGKGEMEQFDGVRLTLGRQRTQLVLSLRIPAVVGLRYADQLAVCENLDESSFFKGCGRGQH